MIPSYGTSSGEAISVRDRGLCRRAYLRTGKAKSDDSGPKAPAPTGSASADARGVEELESSPATLHALLLAVRHAESGTERIPYEGIML